MRVAVLKSLLKVILLSSFLMFQLHNFIIEWDFCKLLPNAVKFFLFIINSK